MLSNDVLVVCYFSILFILLCFLYSPYRLLFSLELVLLLSTASPPRYRGRCCAAIRLSHRPEPSGRVVRGGRWIGQWRTTWSTPGSMAQRPRDSMAPMRRSSAGWMPARNGRLSAGVGRRHPVTIRKESLMVESIRRVWTSCYVNQQEKLGFGKFEFWEVFCEIRHNR